MRAFPLRLITTSLCVVALSVGCNGGGSTQLPPGTATPGPTAAPNPTPSPTLGPTPSPTPSTPFKADFYVASTGKDTWTGKLAEPNTAGTDGPFASMKQAQVAARALIKNGLPTGGLTIAVREGTYAPLQTLSFTGLDSGTGGSPVTCCAYPGEEVRLSGGTLIPPSTLAPVTDTTILSRLDASVQSQVRQVDLKALGFTGFGSYPVNYSGAPEVPELFFNHERMTVARWPNAGWTTIAQIISSGSVPRNGDTANIGGVFVPSEDRASRWNLAEGVWLHGFFCYDWSDETLQIQSRDAATTQITLAAATAYGIKQGNPSPRRYFALNVLEELDAPGEYYLRPSTGMLYFIPPADTTGARIELSRFTGALVSINGTSNFAFKGFTLESSLGSGISVQNGQNVSILACQIRNLRTNAIYIGKGTGHRIEACDIHDMGTGGINMDGGDRKTLTPARHQAINNHIWRFDRHKYTYSPAILVQGVGNLVAHNLVHDSLHQAIALVGNDHILEYNEVHDVAMESDDCGAFYKGRNPSCRGNILRYNFWHHIGTVRGHGVAAIYFDDGDGGDFVTSNVFYKAGESNTGTFGTVFSHGGHGITADNNVFISCKRALGSTPWNDARWTASLAGADWQAKLLQEVDITQPPYTTHYPALVGFMTPAAGTLRKSSFKRNLVVSNTLNHCGNWVEDATAAGWVTTTDPGFVDAAHGNFKLNVGSEVFTRIPGFQAPPFEQMGLIVNELRTTLPNDPWRD